MVASATPADQAGVTVETMQICLVSSAYRPFPSGVSEHVHHLAVELARQKHHVHILTTNYSDSPTCSLLPSGIQLTRIGHALILPANRSRFTLSVGLGIAHRIRRFFASNHFDIVHCHGMFPPDICYWALRTTTAPVVVTNHSLHGTPPAALTGTVRTLFPDIQRKVKAWVAVSDAARRWLEHWFRGKCYVIPNGVDITRFSPLVQPIMADSAPTVLFVGRLDRRKGLLLLLASMTEVLRVVPNTRLLVVGTGPEERSARALCRRLNIEQHITFCGHVPEETLPAYYTSATVYCSPALGGEAMGIVLLEAMASGRTVVAANIPGYNEVVRHDIDGLLFSAGDVSALATTLIRALTDHSLRERLAVAALRRAADFAWPSVASRIIAVYREVR